MKTETSKTSNIIEAVILFAVSLPIAILSLIMVFVAINFLFNILRYGIDAYDVVSFIFSLQFVLIGVFDIIAVVNMIKSLCNTDKHIKNYQYRLKSFINIHKMVVCMIIADIISALDIVFNELEAAIFIFIIIILPISVLTAWRFIKHKETLTKLVVEDLRSKRGKVNVKS